MNYRLGSIIVLVATLIGCGDNSEGAANSEDPSNLQHSDLVINEATGMVSFSSTADNATMYEFDPGDGTSAITNTTGAFVYTYTQNGTFASKLKAFGSSGRFVQKEIVITIQLGGDDSEYEGYDLVWQDEFNGTSLNTTFWNYEMGDGCPNLCGWGNAELQSYQRENTTVAGGLLTIQARQENVGGRSYTSSRLTTQDKFEFTYGRVDIRAQLPYGQGIWPALWMLGSNIDQVGWPSCGEIDIMELIGGGEGRDDTVHGTIHWDNAGTKADVGDKTQLANGIFNDEFHVFSLIWTESRITWFVDGQDDQPFFIADISPSDLSEFRNSFFFIFNIAVGGNWPGSPNANTVFPQEMNIDYIRVFQEN